MKTPTEPTAESRLLAENLRLREQLEALEERCASQRDRIDSLRAELDEPLVVDLIDNRQNIIRLREQLEALEERCASQRDRIDSLRAELDDWHSGMRRFGHSIRE